MNLAKINNISRLIFSSAVAMTSSPLWAQGFRASLEEVVVTARKEQESAQDIPVTLSAVTDAVIQKYGIDQASELANMVPNLTIEKTGAGAGGSLRLRGVGNSSISAAFETAISFNIDGVQVNNARIMQQAMFDLEQIEVLKGPQTLYYGKSASAGVITITSKMPTGDFSGGVKAGYETEERTTTLEGFVSGPLTNVMGARLAVRSTDTDHLVRNNAGPGNIGGYDGVSPPPYFGPGTTSPDDWIGTETQDARLTLAWDPTAALSVSFKATDSEFESNSAVGMSDVICAGPTPLLDNFSQLNPMLPSSVPVNSDCDATDGVIQHGSLMEIEASGAARGNKVYMDSDAQSFALSVDYSPTDVLTLTSVTGYIDMNSAYQDAFGYTVNGGPSAYNTTSSQKNFSQELRFSTATSEMFDMSGGLYYQRRDMFVDTELTVTGIAMLAGPDPVSGSTMDYKKDQDTTVDAYSAFVSGMFRPTDDIDITVGVRYSEEHHDSKIKMPYVHTFLAAGGFLPQGTVVDGLKFNDYSVTPEASVMWHLNSDVRIYGAYKTGFKSGGIDTSLLPTGVLLIPGMAQDLAQFDSEEAKGFEFGLKSDLLDHTLRLNVTAFLYTYQDLQLQEFDPSTFNFATLNAGEIETRGLETEVMWGTPVPGLTLSGALAYTDAEYTDAFFVDGETNLVQISPGLFKENLKGTQTQGNSEWAGNIGIDYERDLTANLVMTTGLFANYRSSYQAGLWTNSYEQEGFWKTDASVALGDSEKSWEVALLVNNIENKRTINAVLLNRPVGARNAAGFADQVANFSNGRQITMQAKYNF